MRPCLRAFYSSVSILRQTFSHSFAGASLVSSLSARLTEVEVCVKGEWDRSTVGERERGGGGREKKKNEMTQSLQRLNPNQIVPMLTAQQNGAARNVDLAPAAIQATVMAL